MASIQVIILMIVLLAMFNFIRFVTVELLQEFVMIDMKLDVYSKFLKKDMSFFESFKSGELVSRLSSDL